MFEHLILNVTVACGLPFSWVENSATKSLFKWINPMLPLPSRRQLSGRILEKSTNKIMENILKEAINDKLGVMLAFDGWKNVSKQNLLGSVLFISLNDMIIWKVEDISGKRYTWEIVYNETIKAFEQLEQQNIKVNGLITDSASENAAARYSNLVI